MEYRNLGRTGLKVSTICMGTMQFGWTTDVKTSHRLLDRALDLGCNFIDTADVYSSWFDGNVGGESEKIIGSWLAANPGRRHDIVLGTKVRGKMGSSPNDEGLSRKHIFQAVDASLRRLQTDYIDLYQVHSPDHDTPLDETLTALNDLVRAGKVRYIGCSNYPAWLLAKSLWMSDIRQLARFDSIQPHYNFIHRAEFERELQPLCQDQRIGVIPYSPLGGGFLTGKYRRGGQLPDSARISSIKRRYLNDRGFTALEKLEEIAAKYQAAVAQIAIAWILAGPTVTSAIIGANNLNQLDETFKGSQIELAAEDKQALDRVTTWNQND